MQGHQNISHILRTIGHFLKTNSKYIATDIMKLTYLSHNCRNIFLQKYESNGFHGLFLTSFSKNNWDLFGN